MTKNITAYNGIATKVAVAGESAGGNLAAEVAIAGTAGTVQEPTAQLLIYPETTSNVNQLSSTALPLYTAVLKYLDGQYLQNPADRSDPRAVPIDNNVAHLPPATIIAAQAEPLPSGGVAYYLALLAARNTATHRLVHRHHP